MSVYTGLFIAVLAVSWASIFVRWCQDTPALVISFYRMFWSSILLLIYQLKANPGALRINRLQGRSLRFIGLAGILLALHFATWIASVQLTTISHSLILESTHPVFAIILSPFLLREKGSWKSVIAAGFTFAGIVIIGGQDFQLSNTKFWGDFLAVLSALFVTLYIFIARNQRKQIDLIPYLIAVYSGAALTLLILILFFGYHLYAYPPSVHGMMFFLALIPTGVGHSLINWAARKIQAYKVNFTILGEPVIASVLAYFIFNEKPYGLFYLGAAFILLGIVLALLDQSVKRDK